jgi:hypothetical protein
MLACNPFDGICRAYRRPYGRPAQAQHQVHREDDESHHAGVARIDEAE